MRSEYGRDVGVEMHHDLPHELRRRADELGEVDLIVTSFSDEGDFRQYDGDLKTVELRMAIPFDRREQLSGGIEDEDADSPLEHLEDLAVALQSHKRARPYAAD